LVRPSLNADQLSRSPVATCTDVHTYSFVLRLRHAGCATEAITIRDPRRMPSIIAFAPSMTGPATRDVAPR
jgi:hypothetical protein